MRRTLNHVAAGTAFLVLLAGAATGQNAQPASPYGADDTLGALNLLSPEHVLAASRLVRSGKAYSLGITTGPTTPAWGDRSYALEIASLGPLGSNTVTAHDDRVVTHLGIGSQIDGFGHAGQDGVHYNGRRVEDFATPKGVKIFGMESLPPIVTRGVLIDMASHLGQDRLKASRVFNSEEIRAAAQAQGVEIRSGDVVLFHTGWMTMMDEDAEAFVSSAPGIGLDGAAFLADRGVVAIGADTGGLEVGPSEDPEQAYPVHQLLLVERGVYILENMNTAALAADKAYEFMFVLGQPKFEGAVQAVINPIAIR